MPSPSRDRVRFKIVPDGTTAKIIYDTMGIQLPRCTVTEVTIVCRPSQFARFLIERNTRGCRNSFKELRAELFVPAPARNCFDASENRHDPDRVTYSTN